MSEVCTSQRPCCYHWRILLRTHRMKSKVGTSQRPCCYHQRFVVEKSPAVPKASSPRLLHCCLHHRSIPNETALSKKPRRECQAPPGANSQTNSRAQLPRIERSGLLSESGRERYYCRSRYQSAPKSGHRGSRGQSVNCSLDAEEVHEARELL